MSFIHEGWFETAFAYVYKCSDDNHLQKISYSQEIFFYKLNNTSLIATNPQENIFLMLNKNICLF